VEHLWRFSELPFRAKFAGTSEVSSNVKYSGPETGLTRLIPAAVIVAVVVAIAAGGGAITDGGMDWYRTLQLPAFTPPGSVIGAVWTVIYILGALAAILIWNARNSLRHFRWLAVLLVLNALLNLGWSWIFFGLHLIGLAVFEMVLLNLTTLAIIALSWGRQRVAALLLTPYFAWVCFATYLATTIWKMNR
jgi:tryptophan-rich sensory protein